MKTFFIILLYIFQHYFTSGKDCPTDYFQHRYYSNKCYYIHNVSMDWYQAVNYCNDTAGAILANIYNRNIHDGIVKRLSDTSKIYHFGLHEHTAGQLVWSFGGDFSTTTSWYIWHPTYASFNNAYFGCAYYIHDGNYWRWGLNQCNEFKYPICEYTIPNDSAYYPVVLVDGDAGLSGRVEIYKDNMWGTIIQTSGLVTDDYLGHIVCAYFDLQFLQWTTASTIRDGTGRIWLSDLDCGQDDNLIEGCIRSAEIWTYDNIPVNHDRDIRLNCTVPSSQYSNAYASESDTALQCPVTLCQETTYTSTMTTTDYVTFTETSITSVTTAALSVTVYTTSDNSKIASSKTMTASASVISPTTVSSLLIHEDTNPTTKLVPASVTLTSAKNYKKKNSPLYSTMTRYDGRPSAVAIGSFGLVIFLSVISFAIFLDILTIKKEPLLNNQLKCKSGAKQDTCDGNEDNIKKLDSELMSDSPNSIDLFCIPPRAEYIPSTLDHKIPNTYFPGNKYLVESLSITETLPDAPFVTKCLEIPSKDPRLTICRPHTSMSDISRASSCRSLLSVSMDNILKPNISENVCFSHPTPYLIHMPHSSYSIVDDIAFPPTEQALYGFTNSETDTG